MRDYVNAVASGVAGTAVIIAVLLVADALAGTQVAPFRQLSTFVGGPADRLVGFVLFTAIGAVAWPLVFLSFVEFLPGREFAVRGMVFGAVLWMGFAVAFAPAAPLGPLAVYVVATLVAHLAYGFVLGAAYARFADHDTPGVSVDLPS